MAKYISRRSVIQGGAELFLLQFFWKTKVFAYATNATSNHLVCGGKDIIYSIDLNKLSVIEVTTNINPHSFLQDSQSFDLATVIEKSGNNAVVFNFKTGNILKKIIAPEKSLFYGHGIYSPDGKQLYLTNVNESGDGRLVVYDTKNYKVVDQLKITPGGLHDCHFSKNGNLLITSSGLQITRRKDGIVYVDGARLEKSAIYEVNLSTGKIISKKQIADDGQAIGHFYETKKDEIIAITIPLKDKILNNTVDGAGQIYFAQKNKEFKKIEIPLEFSKRIKGENLSLAVSPQEDQFFVTNPASQQIFVFNIQTQELKKCLNYPANGLAIFNDNLIVSPTKAQDELLELTQNDLKETRLSLKLKEKFKNLKIESPHVSLFKT